MNPSGKTTQWHNDPEAQSAVCGFAPWRLCVKSVLVAFLSPALLVVANSTDFSFQADAYLSGLVTQDQFSGTVLVASNGNVVFAKGYGLANREHEIPNSTNTIFRLGSVSKQFAAMCVLILQEEGRLNVTNLISEYVEDCPEAWRKITIHHLLTHTSGIVSFTGFPDNVKFERLPTTVADTVKRFRDKPLEFEPGSKMHYSNSGYVLLGYIIEKVSKKSYDEFVTEKIFKPLGMKHSGYDHPATILPNRAAGYSRAGGKIVNCIPFAMDTPHAAGALYSTVGDLLIWDQALCTDRLVSPKTLEMMFTENQGHYCYGWIHNTVGGTGRDGFEHGGAISGFMTHVIRVPKEKVYVVVLSNCEWAKPAPIAAHLCQLFLSGK